MPCDKANIRAHTLVSIYILFHFDCSEIATSVVDLSSLKISDHNPSPTYVVEDGTLYRGIDMRDERLQSKRD